MTDMEAACVLRGERTWPAIRAAYDHLMGLCICGLCCIKNQVAEGLENRMWR
jgi:hypothetical protein